MSTTYLESVEHYLKGVEFFSVGGCPGCENCGIAEDEEDWTVEPSFGWEWCDSCGSSFGGDRHQAHGWIDGEIHHFEVCHDCLFFHANGDEPEEWRQHP